MAQADGGETNTPTRTPVDPDTDPEAQSGLPPAAMAARTNQGTGGLPPMGAGSGEWLSDLIRAQSLPPIETMDSVSALTSDPGREPSVGFTLDAPKFRHLVCVTQHQVVVFAVGRSTIVFAIPSTCVLKHHLGRSRVAAAPRCRLASRMLLIRIEEAR